MPDIRSDLGSYDDRYLACRDLRHAWCVLGYFQDRDEYGSVYKRRVMCDRCDVVRIDTLTGLLPKRSYQYPDGYHLPGVKHFEVRDEALRRAKVYDDEDAMLRAMRRRARR